MGTSFGVQVDGAGKSDVFVFDGEVEVVCSNDNKQRLEEGESGSLKDWGVEKSTQLDADRFQTIWPISSGIVATTPSFQFVPPWPKKLRLVRSNERIFVAREGRAQCFTSSIDVNVTQPETYETLDSLTPGQVKAGTRIRSYILHFYPEDIKRARRADRVTGSITFERPVLGLIMLQDELASSRMFFKRWAAGEGNPRRQVDLTGDGDGDVITLSPDRKTIDLDLKSPGRTSDLIRVIVSAN